MKGRRSEIMTYTGVLINPLRPSVDLIRIEDIAHALSNQCRFTGHTREFYSVAEHSLMVSRMVPPKDALWGLLHDASEAYLSDIASPVKHTEAYTAYREAEEVLMFCIAQAFGLPTPEPPAVRIADRLALGVEARDLMPPDPVWAEVIAQVPEGCPWRINMTMAPRAAEALFLARYNELCGGTASAKEGR